MTSTKQQTLSNVPVNPLNCLKTAVDGHVLIASDLNERCKNNCYHVYINVNVILAVLYFRHFKA